MMGGTKMKKLLFITYMAALAALVGCQQDDELHTNPIPYVTFSASEEQTMVIHKPESLSVEIFCSVNDGDWEDIGDKEYSITFGGAHGDLRLRATSEIGTSTDDGNYKISFENETPVACTGDIRTLVDWENYATANTENAKFYQLFRGCTQLVSAPELPATTLAESCYQHMFRNCTSLNSITMLATDISAFHSLTNWVDGVAANGTFTKAASMTSLSAGSDGIPTGWTVQNYTAP